MSAGLEGGRLSTHVLDTAQGTPAAGVRLRLYWHGEAGEQARVLLVETVTNADGRTDAPLLPAAGHDLQRGEYELEFEVGPYFAARSARTADPPFLGTVPVRFAVADPAGKYHVPLLISPWAYSTYRGS